MKKQSLSHPSSPRPSRTINNGAYHHRTYALIVLPVLVLGLLSKCWSHITYWIDYVESHFEPGKQIILCPQVKSLSPVGNHAVWRQTRDEIDSVKFKRQAVRRLSEAVRVPTQVFDDMPPVDDSPDAWKHFEPFHRYLAEAFPLLHRRLHVHKINTYGLQYTWKGSDDTLKPILLMAHQDVVPVEPSTLDSWAYPPFSGAFDGEWIWGRGSSDDKSGLIGIMSAVEGLLVKGFSPSRTVILAFGFDEETTGLQGASRLSQVILETWGEDSFAFIIDEGGGFKEQYGTMFATPGVAEKGYLDVRVEVKTEGGHSMIPPKHTSIGFLAKAVQHIEDNPFEAHLTRKDVLYKAQQCFAEHGRDVSSSFKALVRRAAHSRKALKILERDIFQDREMECMVGTTQAVDVIHGGVKANSLPESATAIINHRISVQSSLNEVRQHCRDLLRPLAAQLNLSYHAFGNLEKSGTTSISKPTMGSLIISDAYEDTLEPAPLTPTDSNAKPYSLLSGTIKATYNAYRRQPLDSNEVVVSPGMNAGNTDTYSYWRLSPHIFRYNHENANGHHNLHTVNESIHIDAFLEMILFFSTLILNADEASL